MNFITGRTSVCSDRGDFPTGLVTKDDLGSRAAEFVLSADEDHAEGTFHLFSLEDLEGQNMRWMAGLVLRYLDRPVPESTQETYELYQVGLFMVREGEDGEG